jgi:hypothetical protein
MVATFLGSSANQSLPKLESYAGLVAKIDVLRKQVARAQATLASFKFDTNDAIALELSKLHELSCDLATAKLQIHLHVISGGALNTVASGLYKVHGSVLTKVCNSLKLLKRLVPLSPDPSVSAAVVNIPDIKKIAGPSDLPSRLGSIVVVPGNAAVAWLVNAFNVRRAACSELDFAVASVSRARINIDGLIDQLSKQLCSLCMDIPDVAAIAAGAGVSGLWGASTTGMFNMSSLPNVGTPSSLAQLCAGMAFYVSVGLQQLQSQRSQLQILKVAVTALPVKAGDRYVELSLDRLKRAHALRHGRALLSGALAPAEWIRVSTGGLFNRAPVHSGRVREVAYNSTTISFRSGENSLDCTTDSVVCRSADSAVDDDCSDGAEDAVLGGLEVTYNSDDDESGSYESVPGRTMDDGDHDAVHNTLDDSVCDHRTASGTQDQAAGASC